MHSSLAHRIAHAYATGEATESLIDELLEALEHGVARAAEPDPHSPTGWRVNAWVKQGILLGFRLGKLVPMPWGGVEFLDRHLYPPRAFALTDGVRIVPGGTSVRRGACLRAGVVVMPPTYVNVGAYVGENTMLDSHVLVGSCAQIGARVHLSAGCQIGGVLEPVGALPVIIEDDVLIGGCSGVFEGTVVKRRAVIGAGVILTRSTPLYDLVNERVIRAEGELPLIVPENAVVVAGSRPASGAFAQQYGVHLYTPIIVKYRDERTDAATALEAALRSTSL
ncbi:MAG: 2,3,4,5-tetrahydropyridine-2,6-dicarboxylate N-succinyltransferase [Fimbriimonadales bacterium]|nr:MAG: 2,3,4,5-tetrahydropyridine-2,6-dicarboxylate N-succinyltransferase [Fimbriimonadales bacterium]